MIKCKWQLTSYVLLALCSLVGCHDYQAEQKHREEVAKQTLPAKLYSVGEGDGMFKNALWIVEIEGHKYASFGSGLTHLESCPCKQGHNPPSR